MARARVARSRSKSAPGYLRFTRILMTEDFEDWT